MEIRQIIPQQVQGSPELQGARITPEESSDLKTSDTVSLNAPPAKKHVSSEIASRIIFDNNFSTLAWKAGLPCHLTPVPVIGNDGMAYMGSDNGTITKFDINTGKKEWRYCHEGSKKMSEPIFNDQGELIVVADLHRVLILDARTGEKKHELEMDSFSPASPIWGPDGTIIMMSFPDGIMKKEGAIYAVDPRQKPKKSLLKRFLPFHMGDFASKLWEVPLGTKSMDLSTMNPDGKGRNPLRMDNTLFYSDGDRRLVSLDEGNGKKNWQLPVKGEWLSDPFAIKDNMVGAATNREIIAIDARTGKKLWNLDCGNIFGSPSSDGKGTIFYRPDFKTLVAVEDGAVKWKKETGFSPLIIPPVTDKFGGVYIVSKEGDKSTISALDGNTGELRFKLNSAFDVDSAPVVSPGGRILIKMRDGDRRYLCCFESPFNPAVSESIPEIERDKIEEGDGWVRIGGFKLDVR